MEFNILFARSAVNEMKAFRAFDRTRILDEVEKQLKHEPGKPTRNRKSLAAVAPGFDFVPPLWELRVGDFRVFYDLDLDSSTVSVRAVRYKRLAKQPRR